MDRMPFLSSNLPNVKCKCKIKLTSISVTLRWLSVTPLTSRRRSRGRCGGNPEEVIEEEKKRSRWKKMSLEERTEGRSAFYVGLITYPYSSLQRSEFAYLGYDSV